MSRLLALVPLLVVTSACSGGEGGGGGAGCGSADGVIPAGLTVLSFDDGDPQESVRTAGFNEITVGETGHEFDLAEEALWESVRFELDRPARIHGVTVTFANFDANDHVPPFEIGLYPDFGHNGVDYWRDNAHWTGDRCASDVAPMTAVDFALDEPVDIEEPGLVFVAHHAADPEDPTFAFDGSVLGTGTCASWDECRSAVNMPNADADLFYQGVSLSFPYDFVVQLHVEYLEELPAATRFTLIGSGISGNSLHSSWGDYDGDGWEDLLTSEIGVASRLWRNLGDGTFEEKTAESGLDAVYPSNLDALGSWGDYDNDGCLDLYFYSQYPDFPKKLMHSNCDGTFTDVTAVAGVGAETGPTPCGLPAPQTQSATWIDIDGDSFLDLYLANYNCGFAGYVFVDDVFRNRGDGTFEDWTGTHGFSSQPRNGRGTEALDYDQDGDVDLMVHNYVLDPNYFFENLGNGNVEEIAMENGLAGEESVFEGRSYYGHTLGVAWGDVDGDGDFDAVEMNLAHPRFFHFSDRSRVMLQDAETGFFFDIAGGGSDLPVSFAGLRYQEAYTSPVLGDFDLDGDLDLAVSSRYEYTGRPSDFYWGSGDGTFELDSFHTLPKLTQGWGLSTADFDHDGDLDLMTREGLLRNDGPSDGHWFSVRAIGNVRSNRAAIGATVRVYAGDRVMPGWVPGSTSQGSQDTQSLHFGLGAIDVVDGIEVLFPGGRHTRYDGPFPADQHVRVYEDGTITFGW